MKNHLLQQLQDAKAANVLLDFRYSPDHDLIFIAFLPTTGYKTKLNLRDFLYTKYKFYGRFLDASDRILMLSDGRVYPRPTTTDREWMRSLNTTPQNPVSL